MIPKRNCRSSAHLLVLVFERGNQSRRFARVPRTLPSAYAAAFRTNGSLSEVSRAAIARHNLCVRALAERGQRKRPNARRCVSQSR